jgi:hypothetical protein
MTTQFVAVCLLHLLCALLIAFRLSPALRQAADRRCWLTLRTWTRLNIHGINCIISSLWIQVVPEWVWYPPNHRYGCLNIVSINTKLVNECRRLRNLPAKPLTNA